jgi:5-methyltetrahydrofolate--homocysteine methyltransferase
MVAVARELTRASKVPVAVQPNAGLPETKDGAVVYNETPEAMAARVPELLDLGVALVGGCCGTTPDHIRALRNAVDTWQK